MRTIDPSGRPGSPEQLKPQRAIPRKILTVLGTRPEAIKLAPLARLLAAEEGVEHVLCSTGQHRHMLAQVFQAFDIRPGIDLDLMAAGGTLPKLAGAVTAGVGEVLAGFPADLVIVQGDTTTALGAALAAYCMRVPVAHMEAGLRTGDLLAPWPEEGNRRMIAGIAERHFAPTPRSRDNLLAESITSGRILVTGNTGVDALLLMRRRIEEDTGLAADCRQAFPWLDEDAASGRRLVLVTGHRRENFGEGLAGVFEAVARLSRRGDVRIVYPVHLNPNVLGPARALLGGLDNVHLIDPLPYHRMVHLMARAHLIVTDSGGIQEEAPALGVPVLVTRDVTERPEATDAGTARLVGTDTARILAEATALLDDPLRHAEMARAHNPFGDGNASRRIVDDLLGRTVSPFLPARTRQPETAI
jgi:UDP-N-acetylglucosamine 2-epimerase